MRIVRVLSLVISLLIASVSCCHVNTDTSSSGKEPDDSSQSSPIPASLTKTAVTLEYIGNSCTVITAPDGTRIVSDPYQDFERPPGLNRFPQGLKADAVTVSHAHADHNNAEAIGGPPKVLREAGTFQFGMVTVTGYKGFEGSPTGPSENPHVVFVFEIGDVKIVHLGDSGPFSRPDVLTAIENADVLLANIDGYVIPPDQLLPFLTLAKIRTFIPTHYSLSKENRWQEAPTTEEFCQTLPAHMKVAKEGSRIQVTPNMPRQVMIMIPTTLIKERN